MSRRRRGITRRELLHSAALATGTLSFWGLSAPLVQAGQASKSKLGAQYIGKLEGPEIIRDPAKFPKTFREAPMLAELVKAGKLPPLEQRLPVPADLMVIKPLREIGKYGGRWRVGFTGPADPVYGNRIVTSDKILSFDYTGTKMVPSLAKDWKQSGDGKTTTIFLRRGLKWSDGHPFTADDFLFWYDEIHQNREIVTTPAPNLMVGGKQGAIKKADDYTVVFEFPEPNYLFVDLLAGDTPIGGGMTTMNTVIAYMGGYMPAHYLKQFLPKYSSTDEVQRRAKTAGFDGWKSYLRNRVNWALNPDLPVLGPWRTVSPINTPNWTLERNPYYWAVDTAGNQLPYIDHVALTLAETIEILSLRAVAGEYDIVERHLELPKLPVLIENQKKGNYTVRLDPSNTGSDAGLIVNTAFDADPEIAKWLNNRDFRRALSLGIDRDQLNESFWIGLGTPGSAAPGEDMPITPGPEYRKKWAVLDVKQANALLDKIGLTKKDKEGYRLRTDGKGRIRIELMSPAGMILPYAQISEMIKQHWVKIGIDVDVKSLERSLAWTRSANAQHHIMMFTLGGSENLFLFPRQVLPVEPAEAHSGMPFARWYASGGKMGRKPTNPEMVRTMELLSSASGMKEAERIKTAQEIFKIIIEECWIIGTVGLSPARTGVRVVKNYMGNIPSRQANDQHVKNPSTSHPTTFYFKQ